MADISMLGALQPIEPLDFDNYEAPSTGFQLPTKGRYTVRAPENFTFGRTQKGALSATVNPTIVGPTNEGMNLLFTKVSTTTWKRGTNTASQIGDYLAACGFRGKVSDEQGVIDAIESTANRFYEVDLDWRAYNKVTGFQLEGMTNFPSDGKGGYLPYCFDPNAKDETGNPVRLRANVAVSRYIPATV